MEVEVVSDSGCGRVAGYSVDACSNISVQGIYQSLNEAKLEIRLVRVLTIDSSDLICDVATFRMSRTTEYQALSYAWTKSAATKMIELNGRPFYVTPNLHSILRRLGKESCGWMFIDAICVNQEDLEERSSQVRLMQDIYQNATRVMVWLGEDGHGAFAEYKAARYSGDTPLNQNEIDVPSPDETQIEKIFVNEVHRLNATNLRKEFPYEEAVAVLKPFLAPGRWSRCWIIQEIAVAKSLCFRWNHLTMALRTFFELVSKLHAIIEPRAKTQHTFGHRIDADDRGAVEAWGTPIEKFWPQLHLPQDEDERVQRSINTAYKILDIRSSWKHETLLVQM